MNKFCHQFTNTTRELFLVTIKFLQQPISNRLHGNRLHGYSDLATSPVACSWAVLVIISCHSLMMRLCDEPCLPLQPNTQSEWVCECEWVCEWAEWVSQWLSEWAEWVSERSVSDQWVSGYDWVRVWVIGWVCEWVGMTEWVSVWVSEWVCEWVGMTEWLLVKCECVIEYRATPPHRRCHTPT